MKTIITALALSVAAAGCTGSPASPSALVSATQSAPSPAPPTPAPPTAPAPPPQPQGGGLVSGRYSGEIHGLGVVSLSIQQTGDKLTGTWDYRFEGGWVSGAFNAASERDSFGHVAMFLESPDVWVHIDANVTTSDGGTLVGRSGDCVDAACSGIGGKDDYWLAGPVTFVRN